MTDDNNIPDGDDGGKKPPFPGMGTGTPSAPDVTMPPVDPNHRFFTAGGQPTPLTPPQDQPPTADNQPQTEPPADYKLWQQLNKSQLYTKPYTDFKVQFNNQKSVDKLYQGLNESQLYTKPKADFYNQFFTNLPTKEVADSQTFIDNVLKTPAATKAIDKLTGDQFYNNIYQQQQTSGQDKTRIQQPIPIRLPDQMQSDRDNFIQNVNDNPQLARKIITEIKRQNVDNPVLGFKTPKDINLNVGIDKSLATIDHPEDQARLKYNLAQIDSHNLTYNAETKQFEKPTGFPKSLVNTFKKNRSDLADYDYYTSHSMDDNIKYMDKKNANYDPYQPVEKPAGFWGGVGEQIGAGGEAMLKFGAGAVAGRLAGAAATAPELAIPLAAITTMGVGMGTMDFHHVAWKNTLEETYKDLKQKNPNADPYSLYTEAAKQANISGSLAMIQGLALGGEKAPEFTPVRYSAGAKKAFVDIIKNHSELLKSIVPEAGKQGTIAGTIQAVENMSQGKPIGDNLYEAGKGIAGFTLGLGLLRGEPGVWTPGGRANAVKFYSEAPEELVDHALNTMVQGGVKTPQDAQAIKQEVNSARKMNDGMPDVNSLTPEAEHLLQSIKDGGAKPAFISANLKKIATANGVEITDQMKPEDVVNALQNRKNSVKQPETFQSQDLGSGLSDIYKGQYEKDPEGFMKMVADQAHGGVNHPETGEFTSSRPGAEKAFGKPMVDAATAKYPEHIIAEPKEVSAPVSAPEYLLSRHSETDHDLAHITSGLDQHGLAPEGRREVKDNLAKEVMAESAKNGVPITKIIHSGLERTKETGNIVKNEIQKNGGGDINMVGDPGLNTWDIGDFNGVKGKDFKIAQKYFVAHPDDLEYKGDHEDFKGMKMKETFNQYVDRTIKTHTKYEGEGKGTLMIDHSNNMMVMDAYRNNGNKWDDNAAYDYITMDKPEPATLVQNKNKQNAIPEQTTDEVRLRDQTAVGAEMGGRNTESQSTTDKSGQSNVNASTEEKGATQKEEGDGNVRVSGIAQRVQEQLGLKPYEAGKGWSKEDSFAFGKAAIDHGIDPEKAVTDKNYADLEFHERLAVAQAYDNQLTKEMYQAGDKFGEDSKQYKEAEKAVIDFQNSFQHLKTQSSQAFTAQQGEIDIDTGSFVSVKNAVKEKLGRPLTSGEESKVKELTGKVSDLTNKLSDLEQKLTEATDKNLGAGKEKATYKEKAKAIADAFRKLKTKPFTFKDENGNDIDVHTAGIKWNDVVEAGAKIIEKTGEIADGVKAAIDALKDADWYKALSQSDKDKFATQLEQHYQENAPEIAVTKSIDPSSLAKQFIDKKGNKFTPEEAKSIWQYGKIKYLSKGVGFRDMIVGVSKDTGLTFDQVSHAIVTPKTKPISDAMWKQRYDLEKNKLSTQRYVDGQGKNSAIKKFNSFVNIFREGAVFGHGGVFVGTHAGMTLMDLPRMKHTVEAFFNAYKLAYGKTADYEQAMEGLKNSKNYVVAQRSGLQNNPDVINNDSEVISSKLGKLSDTGKRGFNAVKILRQAAFDSHYNALSDVEKADPSSAVSIARIVNNATGATNLQLPPWVKEVTFAGGMEAARWGKLTRNPLEATSTALKALFNPKSVSIGDRVFAKVWASRVGWELTTYAGLLGLNAAIQNRYNGGKNNVNLTDPTKSDWLKMKFGSTTFDFTSGMLSTLNFAKSMIYQPISNSKANVIDKEAETVFKYGMGKLSPFYSKAGEALLKHDYSGNTVPWSDAKPLHSYNHKMTWEEYGESYLPLPVAEGFNAFYESAQQNGMSKPKIDNVLNGLMYGAISGTTGFRAYETAEPKEKSDNLSQ